MLTVQRTAGNRAATALARQVTAAAAPTTGSRPMPRRGEKGADVTLLQLALNRHIGSLNMEMLWIDADFGGLTAGAIRAVRRAHGDPRPSSVVDQSLWDLLDGDPTVDPQAHTGAGPEYDRMLEDGVLDITLASGFDEYELEVDEINEVRRGLTEVRGFVRDDWGALVALSTRGHLPVTGIAELYVKYMTIGEHAVTVVVRYIAPAQSDLDSSSGDRNDADADAAGADARAAALAGMNESDAFIYSGHGRYGAGPDFDRNWTVVVDWDQVQFPRPRGARDRYVENQEYQMIRDLRLGGSGRAAGTRMRALIASGAARVVGHSSGNLGISSGAYLHPDELGGVLIAEATSGQAQPLATSITEDHYRLWIFDACRTAEYEASLRGTGNIRLNEENLDTIETARDSTVAKGGEGLLSYLDGILAGESAQGLSRRMNRVDRNRESTAVTHGFDVRPPPPVFF